MPSLVAGLCPMSHAFRRFYTLPEADDMVHSHHVLVASMCSCNREGSPHGYLHHLTPQWC